MVRFLKYDHPTLYRVISRFHLMQRDVHQAMGAKNLVPTPQPPELISFEVATEFFIGNFWRNLGH